MPRTVALVTDSTALLPREVAAERDIDVVPLQVVIGATSYDEGVMSIEPDSGAPQARTYHVEVVGREQLKASARVEGSSEITVVKE